MFAGDSREGVGDDFTAEGQATLQLKNPPADNQLVQDLGEDYVQIQNEINAQLVERLVGRI